MKKSDLINELSAKAGVSKTAAGIFLETLAEIAYKEARTGFTIPGICRIKVVRRKASKRRNPATGTWMMVGEHDAIKTQPLKIAKERIAPRPDNLIVALPPEEIKESAPLKEFAPLPPAEKKEIPSWKQVDSAPFLESFESPPAPKSTAVPLRRSADDILFSCPDCGDTLVCKPSDPRTIVTCPSCGAKIDLSDLDSQVAKSMTEPGEKGAAEAKPEPEEFVAFVCSECGQQIEAPVEMMGLDINCPICSNLIVVSSDDPGQSAARESVEEPGPAPAVKNGALSSMTMRIDLSDLV